MGISNIGQMNQILHTGNTAEWASSAKINSMGDGFNQKMLTETNFDPAEHRSFSELLAGSIVDVNNLQKDANLAIERLATGKSENIHETLLAVEKAEIAFKAMNQVRAKVIEAYKEIMRMQI